MNLLSFWKETLAEIVARKKTLAVFAALFAVCGVLGICFIKTPAIYGYHLNLCDRFIDRVCYSDRSVILIFFERTCGNALLLCVVLFSGVHPVGLILPPIVLAYRAYSFGGSLAIFFSVYRVSGALIVFVLYLPIHLLIDAVLIGATALSCARASHFRFCKGDLIRLVRDVLLLTAIITIICFLEMLLLLVLFHPLGNLL